MNLCEETFFKNEKKLKVKMEYIRFLKEFLFTKSMVYSHKENLTIFQLKLTLYEPIEIIISLYKKKNWKKKLLKK